MLLRDDLDDARPLRSNENIDWVVIVARTLTSSTALSPGFEVDG